MKTSITSIVLAALLFGTIACSNQAKTAIEARSQCGALKSQVEAEILCTN